MTAFMVIAHRKLPWWQRYALPPRQITRTLVRKAGVSGQVERQTMTAATTVAHFGYGSAAGVPYTTLVDPMPGNPALKGAIYAMGVWAGSYLQLLPALDILYSAKRHPRERNALMIAAHLIWGATLGTVAAALQPDRNEQAEKSYPTSKPRNETANIS